jgi:hypothetical protein
MTPASIALFTAALASALAVPGCGSSSKDTPARPIPGPGAHVAQPAGTALLAFDQQRSIFEVLPGNADMVLGMNILQLRSSQLFVELLPWIKEAYGDSLGRLESECGIDPFTAVHAVTIAGRVGSSSDVMVVARGLERPVLVRCLSRVDSGQGKAVEIVQDGAITHVRQSDESMWLGWLDDRTLVVGLETGRAQLEERMRGAGGMAGNPAMMELIGKVATESGLWLAIVQSPDNPGAVPAPIRALYATVTVVGGLEINGAVRVTDAQQARSLADMMRSQLQSMSGSPLGTYLARIEIAASDSDILMRLVLDDEEVTDLIQQLAADSMFKGIFGS